MEICDRPSTSLQVLKGKIVRTFFRYNKNNTKDELNTNIRSIASLEERMEKELKEKISQARNGNGQS